MEIGAYLVAGPQSFELVEPGEGTLDDPAGPARAEAVGGALAGGLRCDAPGLEEAAVLVVVVAAVGKRAYAAVAAELGATGETLRTWVRKDTAQHMSEHRVGGAGQSPAEELARLRAENARLLKAEKEWLLEREILRRAAAYFAREVK